MVKLQMRTSLKDRDKGKLLRDESDLTRDNYNSNLVRDEDKN